MWRSDPHRLLIYREFDEIDELELRWAGHFDAHVHGLLARVAAADRGARLCAAVERAASDELDEIGSGLVYGMLLMPEERRAHALLELLCTASREITVRAIACLARLVDARFARMRAATRARVVALCAWLAEARVDGGGQVLIALVRQVRAPRPLIDHLHASPCAALELSHLDLALADQLLDVCQVSPPTVAAAAATSGRDGWLVEWLGEQQLVALLAALLHWQRVLLLERAGAAQAAPARCADASARLASACAPWLREAAARGWLVAGAAELLSAVRPLGALVEAHALPATASLFEQVRLGVNASGGGDGARAPDRQAARHDALVPEAPMAGGGRGSEAARLAACELLARVSVAPAAACRLAFLCTTRLEPGSGSRKFVRLWAAGDLELAGRGALGVSALVRYVVTCVRPSNEMIGAPALYSPRWAVVEWLLAYSTNEVVRSEAACALFADWLTFAEGDGAAARSVMGVEPALLLLLHWAHASPWAACELLARLRELTVSFWGPTGRERALCSVEAALGRCLELRVASSLEPLRTLAARLEPAALGTLEPAAAAAHARWRHECLALLAEAPALGGPPC